MSTLGNIAIEAYIDQLLKLIDKNRSDQGDTWVLDQLIAKLRDDKKAAHDGWL